MLKWLLSLVCIGWLSAIGLMLWHQPARAANDEKIVEIVSPGPVFKDPDVTISKGQIIKWVPRTAPGVPHRFVDDTHGGQVLVEQFTNPQTPTHKFDTEGVIKYHCTFHPNTMIGTITVQ